MSFGKKLFGITRLIAKLTRCFDTRCFMAGGPGTFDSIGGTYDKQTGFSFFKTLYYQMRTRSIVGKLSAAGMGGSAQTEQMRAGEDLALQGSSAINRVQISQGDMMRLTLQEHAKGMATYGDTPFRQGDFLAFKNMEARVNEIDSPAIPVQGKMAQQRVRASITNLPQAVREEVLNFMEEQLEFEFLLSLLNGASPSVLLPQSSGGLGITLGVNAAGTAGNALMGRHWYTPQGSYLTYNTTPATWNSAVNTALGAITAGAAGYVSIIQLKMLRAKLDDLLFRPINIGKRKYKALWLTDSDLWYRIDHLLNAYYQTSKPRESNIDNPVFDVDRVLEYDGMLFLNVPNLKKFRPSTNATTLCPDFGPGMTKDPRSYTTTSSLGMMIGIGNNSVIEGYNDVLNVQSFDALLQKGMSVAGSMMEGFIRSEWYAKDGRTDVGAVYSDNVISAAFYEPGVGTGY